MSEYRVNLDIYAGPLDLLLYLIRRDEVDIHNIPIAQITEQYLQYVEMLQQLDPNLAGDFLVLAASLMEIKARMLLPAPEAVEESEEGLGIDPRADLVRQLLQYKAFKDAAGDLAEAAERQSMRFPRRPAEIAADIEKEVDIEDVQIWDLFDAFQQVMDTIGRTPQQHEVIYDDTPLELHQEDILDRLRREGGMLFGDIFAGRTARTEIVGLFLATLELVRLRKVLVRQGENFGEIQVELNPNPPSEEEVLAEEEAFRRRLAAAQADTGESQEGAEAVAEEHDVEDEPLDPDLAEVDRALDSIDVDNETPTNHTPSPKAGHDRSAET
jgi:segregation and condensation protein A